MKLGGVHCGRMFFRRNDPWFVRSVLTHLQLEYIALKSFIDPKIIRFQQHDLLVGILMYFGCCGSFSPQKMKGWKVMFLFQVVVFQVPWMEEYPGEHPRNPPKSHPTRWGALKGSESTGAKLVNLQNFPVTPKNCLIKIDDNGQWIEEESLISRTLCLIS